MSSHFVLIACGRKDTEQGMKVGGKPLQQEVACTSITRMGHDVAVEHGCAEGSSTARTLHALG
eukprot:1150882-Pelagomonas_calceolata.AAC.1